MFGVILFISMGALWVRKISPIIPRHKTGQIKLTATNLEKISGAHWIHTLKIKRTIIKDLSCPGPNVPYVDLA